MIDTQNKNKIIIVGYPQATITNEFRWCLSQEFSGPITVVEPKNLYIDNDSAYLISITKDHSERLSIIDQLSNQSMATFIHSTAVVHDTAQIKPGAFVCPFVGVYYNAQIGSCSIIGPNSIIGHHTNLSNNNIVQPGVIIAGSCKLGDNCLLGVRSTIIDKIEICNNVTVAAGALVTKNITESGKYIGSPARKRN